MADLLGLQTMAITIRGLAESLLIGRHHSRPPSEELRNSPSRQRLQEKRRNDYA
jgi:hypothetical protein